MNALRTKITEETTDYQINKRDKYIFEVRIVDSEHLKVKFSSHTPWPSAVSIVKKYGNWQFPSPRGSMTTSVLDWLAQWIDANKYQFILIDLRNAKLLIKDKQNDIDQREAELKKRKQALSDLEREVENLTEEVNAMRL